MIAIKGMEMPKSCSDCDFCHGHICKRTGTDIITNLKGNCPLVEIVTCKDCKHYYPDEDGRGYHCEKSDTERIPTCADFYCIHGERRE